jgi:hypothetical protein
MTVAQVQKRNGKSQHLKVVRVSDNQFAVESSEGKIFYIVSVTDADNMICSCADFIRNQKTDPNFRCKHIMSVEDSDGICDGLVLERKQPKLDGRFIQNIQGRDFVKYAGLLDLAHQKGLIKLICEIIQLPNKDNAEEAICRATAETKNGEVFVDVGDANPRNTNKMIASHIIRMASTRAKARALRDLTNVGMTALEELGDINEAIGTEHTDTANKTAKAIQKKDLKSVNEQPAGTKASALAPTVPEKEAKSADPAFSGTENAIPETNKATPVNEKPAKTKSNGTKGNGSDAQNNPISEAQRRATVNLARRRGIGIEELDKMVQDTYGVSVNELTQAQASTFIRTLQSAA